MKRQVAELAAVVGTNSAGNHVDIPKRQHLTKPFFLCGIESAAGGKLLGILIGAEQHIPPRDVSVVVAMFFELMMNTVHLRPLEK
jgi:hypothetical protein